MLALTCDIDWAPTEVLEDFINLINSYGVKCTFFCTHPVDIEEHEMALHPNYVPTESFEETICRLKQMFPAAKGIRAHSLHVSSRMYSIYHRHGLLYESNYMLFGQPDIRPFFVSRDVVELPIYFGDYTYLTWGGARFSTEDLKLEQNGLKVFSFHPVHVFLNIRDLDEYQRAKEFYQQADKLRALRNQGAGIRSLFVGLLAHIQRHGLATYTMIEINELWRRGQIG